MKKSIIILAVVLTGCSTQPIPQPAPVCEMSVAGKCRDMIASEKGGAVVRGHGEEVKNEK